MAENQFNCLFVCFCSLHCDLRNSLSEAVLLRNPDMIWKYEGELLCWLFESAVFALETVLKRFGIGRDVFSVLYGNTFVYVCVPIVIGFAVFCFVL